MHGTSLPALRTLKRIVPLAALALLETAIVASAAKATAAERSFVEKPMRNAFRYVGITVQQYISRAAVPCPCRPRKPLMHKGMLAYDA